MIGGAVNEENTCTFINGTKRMRIFSQYLFRFGNRRRIQRLALCADPFQGGIQTVVLDSVAKQHINRRIEEICHFYEQIQLGL